MSSYVLPWQQRPTHKAQCGKAKCHAITAIRLHCDTIKLVVTPDYTFRSFDDLHSDPAFQVPETLIWGYGTLTTVGRTKR